MAIKFTTRFLGIAGKDHAVWQTSLLEIFQIKPISREIAGLQELSGSEFVAAVTGQIGDHLLEQMHLGSKPRNPTGLPRLQENAPP